jgi:hypothetical protein
VTSLQSPKPLDVLHFLYNVNRTVLNIARAEKQREFRLAAKAAL